MGRSESRSDRSNSESSSVEREDRKKKKDSKSNRRSSRSRSNNNNKRKGGSAERDRKNRGRKDSSSKERKKAKKRDASADRKQRRSSRSKDRKRRSASKDKRKKREKSISKKKRDKSESPKRKRNDRSNSASRRNKDKYKSTIASSSSYGQYASAAPAQAQPQPELTEKELELKKQRERLAKMRLLKFAAGSSDDSSDDGGDNQSKKQQQSAAQVPVPVAAAPAALPANPLPISTIPATQIVTPTDHAATVVSAVQTSFVNAPIQQVSSAGQISALNSNVTPQIINPISAVVPVPAVAVAAATTTTTTAAATPIAQSVPFASGNIVINGQLGGMNPPLITVNIPQQPHQVFQMSDLQIRSNAPNISSMPSWPPQQQPQIPQDGDKRFDIISERPVEDGQSMMLRKGFEYIEDLIRQKQEESTRMESEEAANAEGGDEDGTRGKKILYDSDGLEEFSDEEEEGNEGESSKKASLPESAAVDAEKKKKLQAMLSKGKSDDADDVSNVFGGSKSSNSASNTFTFAAPKPVTSAHNNPFTFAQQPQSLFNQNGAAPTTVPGKLGLNGATTSKGITGNGMNGNGNNSNNNTSHTFNNPSTIAGFNPIKTQLPQQLTPDEDSEEDELDAYCRMLDEQLESETPFNKRAPASTKPKKGKKEDGNEEEEEQEEEPTNYITMEEIFGKKEVVVEEEEEYVFEDENDEFVQLMKREKMELEEANAKQKAEAAAAAALEEEEEDDEHYRAFQEAMRKKKAEMTKDHTGDLLMDDEQEIEEKTVHIEMETGENKEDYLERLKREASKKDLKPVEYKPSDLEKFRKNFYIESKEISNLTEEEVASIRENLGEIAVRGLNVPRPIRSWYQSGLSDRVLDVLIKKKKYDKPFPIQCQSLPVIMSGRDMIGIAETGSGKTLAYILPMIRHIADQRPHEEGDGPIGLIIVPTRELAIQIYMEAMPFLKPYQFDIVAVFGGTGIQGQLSELKRGCEIVVCTPGRLFDVLTTSNGKITNLKRATMVVIDEADRMFDLGFEPQIAKILATTRPDKQTVLFSATFPKNVESLARKLMKHKPVEVMVGARGQACTNITQIIEIREEPTRIYRLLELLGIFCEQGQVIIFVDKQTEVDSLYTQLRMQHYNPTILHAGVDADDRTNNLLDFKKGIYRILIATSVSSRGIDVKNVVLVVNYRCPNHIEDYIHRIGRTGRAGNKGTAVTFISKEEERYSLDLIKVMKRSDQKVPLELLVMGEEFKQKLKTGEAKQYGNKNMEGKGYSFDEEELDMANKAKFEQKKFVALKMGIEVEDKLDEDDIFKKKSLDEEKAAKDKKSNKPELTFQQKLHIVLTQDEYKELREQMLSESSKIAVMRKNLGQGDEAIKKATEEIFRKGLENFKPTTKNVDIGKNEIAKMLQEFEKNNEEENNQNVAELVINDYPENVRKAITRKDFLERIYVQTGCTVLQRGVLVDVGKKVLPGFQKLFLRIEGDSRFKVMMAYKDLKSEAEERSIRMHERGQNQGNRFQLA